MVSIRQAALMQGQAGNPLPAVFRSLTDKDIRFQRGQVCLISAGPGVGKSAFILAYAVKSRVPTLYFSADSDVFTQHYRMISILTGWDRDRASAAARTDDSGGVGDRIDEIPIEWDFTDIPTLDHLEERVDAYDARYEDVPELIIVDNISNVLKKGDEHPFDNLETLMEGLQVLCTSTGACVVGLHHVQGQYNDGNQPIPLSGIKGQIGRVPQLILTMHKTPSAFGGADWLNVSAVKNRSGRADASGSDYASLEFNGFTMQIKDP